MKVAIVNHPDAHHSEETRTEGTNWAQQIALRLSTQADVTIFERAQRRRRRPNGIIEGVNYHYIHAGFNNAWNSLNDSVSLGSRHFSDTKGYHLPWVMRLARIIRKGRFDIVHVQDYSNAIPTLRSMLPKTKIILHLRDASFSRAQRSTMKKRLLKCNLVVGSTRHIRDRLRKQFPQAASRVTYIPSGVDVKLFHPDPAYQPAARAGHDSVDYRVIDTALRGMLSNVLGEKFESGAIDTTISATVVPTPDKRRARLEQRILYVGDIAPEQGIHDLIDAFAQIAPHFPQATLELVGKVCNDSQPRADLAEDHPAKALQKFYYGDYMEHLRKRIPEKLWRRIKFTSPMMEDGLVRRYRQSAMVVNSAYFDGSLMNLIEAGSCGKPTIATRTGSTSEVVLDGDTGFLIEPGDVHMMAQSMGVLLMDLQEQARMGRNARVRVKHLYRWNPVARATLDSWQRLLNHRAVEQTAIMQGIHRKTSMG